MKYENCYNFEVILSKEIKNRKSDVKFEDKYKI
jgi:hypothetical protein